jgi:hypothetical protein
MRRFLLAASAIAALAFAPGCTGEQPGNDVANNDAAMDTGGGQDVRTDTRTDAPADTGTLYQQCTRDADCGAGSTCNLLFPGGLCTRRCTNDRACGNGVCDTQLGCLPSCTPHGGGECDQFGSSCFPYDAAGTQYICFPSCFPTGTTPPANYTNNCGGANSVCDPNVLLCVPPDAVAMGAAVGEGCMTDQDCASGRCIAEISDTGEATGYIGGQCFAVGRLPSGDSYQMGMPLPRSNCPMNSVAIPFENTDAEGDPAICLRSCVTDADCGRAGYSCYRVRDMAGAYIFSNGLCEPANCNDPAYACPSGYHCVTDPSDAAMPQGHCEAGGTDGGVTDVVDVPVTTDVPVTDVPVTTDVPATDADVDASIGD